MTEQDTTPDSTPQRLRLSDLPNRKPTRFRLEPEAEARAAIATRLDLLDLRKLRFAGTLTPQGRRDWRLEAELGATVVQPCVVTLEPVTTRLDEPVARTYAADWIEPEGDEVEMPEDETIEGVPEVLDLAVLMEEALALALPLYPRAPGAELQETVVTEPGAAPLTDEKMRPLAGLAALKDKLFGGDADQAGEGSAGGEDVGDGESGGTGNGDDGS